MLHFSRIMEINERLWDIDYELDCGFSAEVETNLMLEQTELEAERERLEAENEDFRDGYDAGVEYHLGSGKNTRDDKPRSSIWMKGWYQAGDDS